MSWVFLYVTLKYLVFYALFEWGLKILLLQDC